MGFLKFYSATSVLVVFMVLAGFAQEAELKTCEYVEENHVCFKCHSHKTFYYFNDVSEKTVKERMNPYFIIDSIGFCESNHRNLSCTDCHSTDYENFPHSGDLRMEERPQCMDCHEGDDAYARFNFEEINEQFHNSVHATKHSEDFTCSMCHNPHSYKINARTNSNISETIVYDNNICLSCHANMDKYQLISNINNPNIMEKHDWLPNQVAHFANVRCIECHTQISDSTLVAHQIQTKDKAVKNCIECHSQNSILMASLYKFQSQEQRNQFGFFNAAILNNSYIIGANRNYYLNVVSQVLFGIVLLIIVTHAILRFKK